MKRCAFTIAAVSFFLAAHCAAAEFTAGEATVTTGEGRALWARVSVGGTVVSDFASPEKGRPLDVSHSRAKPLSAKARVLPAGAPCVSIPGVSRLGDRTVTLQNGLVKVVIVPAYGGRIIEISNAVTGANIFTDNYQNATKKPQAVVNERTNRTSAPASLGGWIESVDDGNQAYWNTPHRVETVKASPDEVVVRTVGTVKNNTWGVDGTVTVERTIGIRKGSAVVRLHIKFTNHSGQKQREMRFRPMVRHALGERPEGDEFWISSLGYVTYVPNHARDCYNTVRAEQKIDTWQGIVDPDEREGVVVLPGGEISDRMDIYGSGTGEEHWYTYENTSSVREHVVEGITLEVDHDYAPVLNFDAVTFATPEVAVEFVPEKVHFAPGETVKALIGAAGLGATSPKRLTLTPTFARGGKVIAKSDSLTVDAGLLVADPKLVTFDVPGDLAAGPCDLRVEVASPAGALGVFRYRAFVAERAGTFLRALAPADEGYGKGLAVTGKRVEAEVVVEKTGAAGASGVYKLAGASLPWQTRIAPAGAALKVEHTVDLSNFPRGLLLQSLGMGFPCRLGTDVSRTVVSGAQRLGQEHQRLLRVTVGSTSPRDEQWLVDQGRGTGDDQEYHRPAVPYWALSDSADRLPVWRFGGVLQMRPTSAWVWKSSGYDVAPMPMVQEEAAAGWVDAYSLLTRQGVLVHMPDMAAAPPKEVIFDGEAGVFQVYFFPPHVPAMSLAKAGRQGKSRAEQWGLGPDKKVTFTFFVLFHSKDLTGHLPDKGNVAGEIRNLVDAMTP